MRRFASIDFMRGLAIWMMVIFHVIMRWYDYEWVKEGEFEGAPLAVFVIFILVLYFSAWAGFFLMVSSIGNMISMYRNLDRGKSWKKVVMFQVVGGSMLLVAAVLVESAIGYHGYAGELAMGNSDKWHMLLWRGYHMETIHAIALCIIVNGIVQGLLSRNGGHRNVRRNVAIYAFLAGLCIALTGPVYKLLRTIVPGYPNATWHSSIAGELEVQYSVIGESSVGDILLKAIMAPLGGNPEPLLPYLAIAFIGSIIGIYLCQQRCPRKMPRNGILIGTAVMLLGLVGTVSAILLGAADIENFTENFFQIPSLYPGLWLWWFLFLIGGQLVIVLFFIRLIEFRGRGSAFGKRTLPWRRYGYVAFTVYTYQFIDVLPRLLYRLFPDLSRIWPYPERMGWLPVLVMIPMTLLLWELVLRAWEKIEYAGGMEWCLAKVSEKLLPGRRDFTKGKRRWWQAARLDAREYLYRPEWLDVVKRSEVDHGNREDSRLALLLSLGGIILVPISISALWVGRTSMAEEGRNWRNVMAVTMSLMTLLIYSVLMVVLFFIEVPSL
ncbi:MAG: heparan-alpha-glucosaminide N-acetyltransferase domain-containing protein [Thermoplasmatota archaeon]